MTKIKASFSALGSVSGISETQDPRMRIYPWQTLLNLGCHTYMLHIILVVVSCQLNLHGASPNMFLHPKLFISPLYASVAAVSVHKLFFHPSLSICSEQVVPTCRCLGKRIPVLRADKNVTRSKLS